VSTPTFGVGPSSSRTNVGRSHNQFGRMLDDGRVFTGNGQGEEAFDPTEGPLLKGTINSVDDNAVTQTYRRSEVTGDTDWTDKFDREGAGLNADYAGRPPQQDYYGASDDEIAPAV
jgi:hypothetical protein